MSNFWRNKKVMIIGGAALIGSHLAERLIEENCSSLLVFDNEYSGDFRNLPKAMNMYKGDARETDQLKNALTYFKPDVVFHLACQHGGRGFVGGGHEIELWDNLTLDGKVFRLCAEHNVQKVIFMSSACAYPTDLQGDINSDVFLTESMIDYNNIKQADGPYGTAKLMGEHSLKAYVDAGKFDGAIVRGFTVYGPRMKENHAICALIAKTFIKQDPFEIWGDGNQKRNWTYVTDTVNGLVLAAEFGKNAEAYNIGVKDVHTPNIAVRKIWGEFSWKPQEVILKTDKPTGPVNRIANPGKAARLLGWSPKVTFEEGIQKTIEWYLKTHKVEDVLASLERKLYSK